MSITFYCGLPGHGKSLSVVKNVIVPNLIKGRKIVTNIPLNLEGERSVYAEFVEFLPLDANMTHLLALESLAGKVLILDEFWRFCASGLRASNIPEEFKEFWAMHRHLNDGENSTEIILISQNAGQICAFVKGLIDKTIHVTKIKLGRKNLLKTNVYTGCYPDKNSQYVRTLQEGYDSEYFAWYKSQTLGGSGLGSESESDRRDNLLSVPFLKYGLPLSIVAILVAGYYAFGFLAGGFGADLPADSKQDAKFSASQSVEFDSDPVAAVDKKRQLPTAEKPVKAEEGEEGDSRVLDVYVLDSVYTYRDQLFFNLRVFVGDGSYYFYDQDDAAHDGFRVRQVSSCNLRLDNIVVKGFGFNARCNKSYDDKSDFTDTLYSSDYGGSGSGAGADSSGLSASRSPSRFSESPFAKR